MGSVLPTVSVSPLPLCLPRSFAAATTHRLKGVPFWPLTCFLLRPLHARAGLSSLPMATFAMAVTRRLKAVPLWPLTCLLLWPWQRLP